MVNLIKVLDDLGVAVTYFPVNTVDRTERKRLLGLSEVAPIEVPKETSVARHLRRSRGAYRAAILCRLGPAERSLPTLRRLSPQTWTIFDTVDLHHLRELRQSEVEGDPVMRANALKVPATAAGPLAYRGSAAQRRVHTQRWTPTPVPFAHRQRNKRRVAADHEEPDPRCERRGRPIRRAQWSA